MDQKENVDNVTYTFGKDKDGGSIAPFVPSKYVPEVKYFSKSPEYSSDDLKIDEYEKLLIDPQLDDFVDYQKKLSILIKEFLASGSGEDFYQSISEIDKSIYRYEIVNQIVDMGLDQIEYGKELACKLLSYLYTKLLLMKDVEVGYYCVLKRESDLSVDIPDINMQLGRFIARAIFDEILPPAFITREHLDKLPSIQFAKTLMSFQENHAHTIWGLHSSGKLSDLKAEIAEIIRLYFLNADLKQCIHEIQHLHCEYYHHEIIRAAISLAMDYKGGETLLLSLIKEVLNTGITDISQIKNGFLRIESGIEELEIDVPKAREFLFHYKSELAKCKIVV